MRKMNLLSSFVGVAATLSLASISSAVIMYAPNGLARPYPFQGPDTLVRFDSSNPAGFVTVGSMNVPNIGFGGMDFDRDGNLWAYASFFKTTGGAAAGLYKVNTDTGQATLQGTASLQSLQDMAFNPTNNTMYGINTQNNITRLYTVNLTTGGTSVAGTFTGLPTPRHALGLAIDSSGNYYVNDVDSDSVYKSGPDLALSVLYVVPQDTNASQGMTIDWSRGNAGYHASVGQGDFPNYFSTINPFAIDGSSYTVGPNFGPNEMYDGFGYPLVEPGDLAIAPLVPEPATLGMLALGATLSVARRRRH